MPAIPVFVIWVPCTMPSCLKWVGQCISTVPPNNRLRCGPVAMLVAGTAAPQKNSGAVISNTSALPWHQCAQRVSQLEGHHFVWQESHATCCHKVSLQPQKLENIEYLGWGGCSTVFCCFVFFKHEASLFCKTECEGVDKSLATCNSIQFKTGRYHSLIFQFPIHHFL